MKINKNQKLHKCVSAHGTRDVRMGIEGILFDKSDSCLVATDGHILARVKVDDSENDAGCIIPVKAYQESLKGSINVIESNGKIKVNNETEFDPIKEIYPNYKLSLSDKNSKPLLKIALNAKLLYNLSQGLGCDNVVLSFDSNTFKDAGNYLTFESSIKVEPQTPDKDNCNGIIMPRRIK